MCITTISKYILRYTGLIFWKFIDNNNDYFKVLFLWRTHSPFIIKKKQQQRCEHIIRKNQQIKSTVHDANNT